MTKSAHWIKKIEPEIVEAASLPSYVSPPDFPFDQFSEILSQTLGIENLEIGLGSSEWKVRENYYNGLGSNPLSLGLQMSPLQGNLFWVVSFDDMQKLTSWLKDRKDQAISLDHPDLLKGLYRYIFVEALKTTQNLGTYGNLALKLVDHPTQDNSAFAIDVSIKNGSETIWGRLLLSSTFYTSFSNYYASQRPSLNQIKKGKDIKIPLSIEVGSVSLTSDELKSLSVGDFIVAEQVYYHVEAGKGSCKIYLNERAIFQAKIRENQIKILDYIFEYEEKSHGR